MESNSYIFVTGVTGILRQKSLPSSLCLHNYCQLIVLSAVGLGVQLILLFNTGTFMFGNSFGLLTIVKFVC